MIFEWLDTAASITTSAFVNGIWIGALLAVATWGAIRMISIWHPLNATTRFFVWMTVFMMSAGLVVWQGERYIDDKASAADTSSESQSARVHLIAPAPPYALVPSDVLEPLEPLSPLESLAPLAPLEPLEPLAPLQAEAPPAAPSPEPQSAPLSVPRPAPEPLDADEPVAPSAAPAALSSPKTPAPIVNAASSLGALSLVASTNSAPSGGASSINRIEFTSLNPFWRVILFSVWGTVAGMLLLRVLIGWQGVWRLKKNSYPAPPRVQALLKKSLAQIEQPRPMVVNISDEVQTAVAIGFQKPAILLPAAMLGTLSTSELEQVILHEAAHLQRRDDWTMLCQRIITALLFFHPGILFMGRLMDRDREFASDDWVIALTKRPKAYASCLAKLVAQHVRKPAPIFVPGFSSSKEELFDRVKTILDKKRTISFKLSRITYAGVLLMATLLLLLTVRVAPVIALPDYTPLTAEIEEATLQELPAITPVDEPLPDDAAMPAMIEPATPPAPILNLPENKPTDNGATDNRTTDNGATDNRTTDNVTTALSSAPNLKSIKALTLENAPASNDAPVALPQPRRTIPIVAANKPVPADTATTLSEASMSRILLSASRIPSSGDKTQVLLIAARKMRFTTQGLFSAYLQAVESAPSSADKARALNALLENQKLDAASAVLFLKTTARIPSSSDKSRVLLKTLDGDALPLHDESVQNAFLDTIEKLPSSADYRRLMKAFINRTT